MKRYNTPYRSRIIKTRMTEEEYTEFSERVSLCQMSQAEYIRQALTKSRICPVITVSPVNDELLPLENSQQNTGKSETISIRLPAV